MGPILEPIGCIKKGEDGMNLMRPEGLVMLDDMGKPLKVDFRDVLLIPIMDQSGRHPVMENGEPRMQPEGIPMLAPNG